MQPAANTTKQTQDPTQLVNYLKKHYEHICKLCAIGNIPHLPAIKKPVESNSKLTTQAQSLESALNHIKTQLRQIMVCSDHTRSLASQIMQNTELCESLSNYRRDLEALFQQLKSIQHT